MTSYDYDLITIGAGSGGVRASRLAAQFGARVAIVEESRVGGTCVIRGCVPKKLLVYGAHFADEFEDAEGYGWTLGEKSFSWPHLIAAKNKEIDRLNGVYERLLADNHVSLLRGRGRVIDPHKVEVDGKTITARHILVSTGSWPYLPDIPGIEHVITSNEALELDQLPKRIVIVGGGYIAVEFAGVFSALGSEVTVIIRAETLLRGFDEDLRWGLDREMKSRGVSILNESVVNSIEKTAAHLTLTLRNGSVVEADTVMYATGRRPKTKDVGLTEVGVEMTDNGAIVVDAQNRSTIPSIHAIGDVTDRVALTPVAIAEGAALANHLFNNQTTQLSYANIPTAVFSQPPIGTVGLSEQQALDKGYAVDVYVSTFTPMKHSLSGRAEKTFMKLLVDRDNDRVLGCHMLGLDAPEIIQGMAIALNCGATKSQFDATIGVHPSTAEEFVTMRNRREPS